MHSLVHTDTCKQTDTVIQMARCSFDINVQETLGTLDDWSHCSYACILKEISTSTILLKVMEMETNQLYAYRTKLTVQLFQLHARRLKISMLPDCLRTVWTGGK